MTSLLARLQPSATASAERVPTPRSTATQLAVGAVAIALVVVWGLAGTSTQLATDILMFVALAYSWNLISGYTGYVSFGQVLFFGYGAMATALMIIHWELPWLLAVALAGVSGGLVAVPLGAVMLRLRGIFFALGMFGLVFVASLVCSQWDLVGGSTGLVVPGVLEPTKVIVVMAVIAALGFLLTFWVSRSSFGLMAMAVRDDEEAAAASGVPTTRVKVTAFALSAVLPAAAGGVVAYNRAFIDHSTVFDGTMDLQIIVFVLAGGIGTLWGPMIGAVVLTLASDRISEALPDYELALFGLLVILITLFLPGGLASAAARWGWLRRDVVKALPELPPRDELERRLELDRGGERLADGAPLLECSEVQVRFGGVQALRSVDFTVAAGETRFIIGANGAGKTTLFNAVTGLVRPTSGTVVFDGKDLARVPVHRLARLGLVRTFQIPRPFESMTVWENVLVGALGGRYADRAVEQAAWAVRVLGLEEICHEPTRTLAVGHRRMLELCRALAAGPRMILLDEVMAGMSEEELERVRDAIRLMPSVGVDAIAGIEHVIKGIVDLSSQISVLDGGAMLLTGPPREVLAHPEVVRAYLGTPLTKEVAQ
jgi:branched-chain amino acid transport system permease protein